MKLTFGMSLACAVLMTACGVDVTNKKFGDEKDKRLDAQQQVRAFSDRQRVMRELLANLAQSTSYQWAYVSSWYGEPFAHYNEALDLCGAGGFEMPTEQMLMDEGATIPGIRGILEIDEREISWIYTQGGVEQKGRYLVCARSIAQ